MLLEGMHIPVLTPFHGDGRLHVGKLEQNVVRYSLTPAAGMVVLGSLGEAGTLSDEETRAVLRGAIGAAAATKVMVAGVSRAGVRETLRWVDEAAALRYDAVLVGTGAFAGLSTKEQWLYLEMVADSSALPVVLTGDVPWDWIVRMSEHPGVIGYLDGYVRKEKIERLLAGTAEVKREVRVTAVFAAVTGRMRVQEQGEGLVSAASLAGGAGLQVVAGGVKTRTKIVGFQVLVEHTGQMLAALGGGAVGVVPALAAGAPQACYEVYAAWKDGDQALAEEKQQRVHAAGAWVESCYGVAGVKYAAERNGYYGGRPRLPRLGLDAEGRERMDAAMDEVRS